MAAFKAFLLVVSRVRRNGNEHGSYSKGLSGFRAVSRE